MERDGRRRQSPQKLQPFGLTLEEVRAFIANPGGHFEKFNALAAELDARGMKPFYQLDPTIVRGLAYYTGVVFEVFDRKRTLRAIAGGGRYDNLLALMSDGKVDLPAFGFGMGDVVLGQSDRLSPGATARMRAALDARSGRRCVRHHCEGGAARRRARRRPAASASGGLRLDFALAPAKVGKQFQAAEQAGARLAILIGDEWPQVKIKTLATREEILVPAAELSSRVQLAISN